MYFDGTGNNEKIDAPTFEHSNVARLYRAMPDDARAAGRFTFYVPGIGTPFREIGDPGGKLAMVVALGGEKRLEWAMQRIEKEIRSAEARAKNPANKIRSINIALFGFSRGAALARAFALQIEHKCRKNLSGLGQLWQGKYPTRLYFMGLFDTVAAVGAPTSARKYRREAALTQPLASMMLGPVVGVVPVLVTSTADGHMDWASDLRIPAMVEDCVHFCAAHENRNSFPLDTVLEDARYPGNCTEMVYPGVHSNVGGGYRPGEGGRNRNRFAMISLIPLKAMYSRAIKAGVPLKDIHAAESRVKDDFLPPEASDIIARNQLSERFNHYMTVVGWGGKPIGVTVSDHMRMYFRWRIHHVVQKRQAREAGHSHWEAERLRAYDNALAPERTAKRAEEERKRAALLRAADGSADKEQLKWALIQQSATVNTMPSEAQTLIDALDKYDRQFIEDSKRVLNAELDGLRPFERVLRDAWDAPDLADEKIIALFDEYVTDSLAGFDSDRTRAVDHRWLYQGGDDTIDYAALPSSQAAVA
ncbi:T6SS phospholipase effector Tle1-like catalytic domain-containing protein [Lysobacter sp. A378]